MQCSRFVLVHPKSNNIEDEADDTGDRHRSGASKYGVGRDRRDGKPSEPCGERHLPFRRGAGSGDAPSCAARTADPRFRDLPPEDGSGRTYLRQQGRGGHAQVGPGARDRFAGARADGPCRGRIRPQQRQENGGGRRPRRQGAAHMVRMQLPGVDIAGPDAADALAVAICHAHHGGASTLATAIARASA